MWSKYGTKDGIREQKFPKFTDVTLDDLAPVMDSHAVDTEVWCLESMNDEENDQLRAFVLAVWTFIVTSLSAHRGKRGLDPKGLVDQREAEDEDPGLTARSQGCTGAAEEEVVERRLVVMKAKVQMEGDRRLYTTKLGAEGCEWGCCDNTYLLGYGRTFFAVSSLAEGRSMPVPKTRNAYFPQ